MFDNEFSTNQSTATAICDANLLKALLKRERDALATYELAMAHIEGERLLGILRQIHDDHQDAASWLHGRLHHFGMDGEVHAEEWACFVSLVAEAGKLMGPATALAALKQGEQHGINEYEESLYSNELTSECKEHIRSRLLPECYKHMLELDHMMAQHEPRK